MGEPGDGRIVATAGPPRVVFFLLVIASVQTVMYTFVAYLGSRELRGIYAVLAVVAGVLAGLGVAVWRGGPLAQLALRPDSLAVDRRWRPYSIARTDILGVHGNIAGRPLWSEQLILETTTGRRKLPGFTERPAELIPLLQAWAEVGDVAQPNSAG